ncbi:NAD(P)H-dependent oxidoreductase, partial [Acinetobacter baumannii]
PWMHDRLAQSDALIDELLAADVIVAGVPMYNFGMPAQFKAYIDNIVRVGRTFGFDRSRAGAPYWPLLAGMNKRLVILSSRG